MSLNQESRLVVYLVFLRTLLSMAYNGVRLILTGTKPKNRQDFRTGEWLSFTSDGILFKCEEGLVVFRSFEHVVHPKYDYFVYFDNVFFQSREIPSQDVQHFVAKIEKLTRSTDLKNPIRFRFVSPQEEKDLMIKI